VDKAKIKEALEEEASLLEDELSKIKARLEELKPEESNRDEQ
jgi:predicted nuclease with TOPRIM domain